MTRPARGRYTPTMLYLIAALALLPTLALADVAGPAKVIDGDTTHCHPRTTVAEKEKLRVTSFPQEPDPG